jgi:predicted RNA-binding Zn ribbon-like protein
LKTSYPVIIEHRRFSKKDLIGGDAALDFINTVTGRDRSPRDWLDSYERLLEWSELVQLLPKRYLQAIRKQAHGQNKAASDALGHAKILREALFAIVSSVTHHSTPPKAALALLREYWIAGTAAHDLRVEENCVVRSPCDDSIGLDLIAYMIAYRTVHYVLLEPTDRLRICDGENCSWLFLDRSKSGRRRWCDMAVCGNTAKSRRFYERSRSDSRPRMSSKRVQAAIRYS